MGCRLTSSGAPRRSTRGRGWVGSGTAGSDLYPVPFDSKTLFRTVEKSTSRKEEGRLEEEETPSQRQLSLSRPPRLLALVREQHRTRSKDLCDACSAGVRPRLLSSRPPPLT